MPDTPNINGPRVTPSPGDEPKSLTQKEEQKDQIGGYSVTSGGATLTPQIDLEERLSTEATAPTHPAALPDAVLIEKSSEKVVEVAEQLSSTVPLLSKGGIGKMRDIFGQMQHPQRREFEGMQNANGARLKSREVQTIFESFLKEDGIHGIKSLVDQFGKEAVRHVATNSFFVHLASEYGNLELVQYLVDELNCDPNTFFDDLSPLIYASMEGKTKVVDYLLSRSSPKSFQDRQECKIGIISYADMGSNVKRGRSNNEVIQLLVDKRNDYPIPIAGSLPAASHILRSNREMIVNWLQTDLQIPIKDGESDASLLAKVVEAANSRDKNALFSAVQQNNPVLVDLIIAAGAAPDQKNSAGQSPIELTTNPLIQRRLTEAQEAMDSFRKRQLEHLLKNENSETMSPADQLFSWSTMIATLESTPFPPAEFQDLASLMKKSLAVRYVIESPLFSDKEKKLFLREQLNSLEVGECVMLNTEDRKFEGHYTVNLLEKKGAERWFYLHGNRYKSGTREAQVSDRRFRAISDERSETSDYHQVEQLCLGHPSLLVSQRVEGKIKKKWQGAQNNCVTQSDTVAFDYVLGERLGQSKAALYRRLKPLRLAYLYSSLKHQEKLNIPTTTSSTSSSSSSSSSSNQVEEEGKDQPLISQAMSDKTLRWLKSPSHMRFTELCPLIIPEDAYQNNTPQDLLRELDCFITSDQDGNLSLWQKGSDGPTKTAPWYEWQSLVEGIPKEAYGPTRQLYQKAIERLTGPGTHLSFSIDEKTNEGAIVCDLFNPPVTLHCQILPTGVILLRDTQGDSSTIINNFTTLWNKLSVLVANEALANGSQPNPQIIKGWLTDVMQSAYRKSFRALYPKFSGNPPPMGSTWTEMIDHMANYFEAQWKASRPRPNIVISLMGHEAETLMVAKPYRNQLITVTDGAISLMSGWGKAVQETEKRFLKTVQIDTVTLQPPADWERKLQSYFDAQWNTVLSKL